MLTSFQRPKTIVGMVEWATDDGRLALRTRKGIQNLRQVSTTLGVLSKRTEFQALELGRSQEVKSK